MGRRGWGFAVGVLAMLVAVGCENGGEGSSGSTKSTGPGDTKVAGTSEANGAPASTNGKTQAPGNTKATAGPFEVKLLSPDELKLTMAIFKKKCRTCHKLDEKKGLMDSPGFLTTAKTLPDRLTRYEATIKVLKKRSMKTYQKNAAIIDPILAEQDKKRRMWMWLHAYCKDPKFDDPKQKMNKVPGLAAEEIEILVRYIMTLE